MGGTHSIECNSAAKDIWQFCIKKEICISAALIPGKNNTQAGRESMEFLLIIRGGMAEARHISTSYKNLVEPPLEAKCTGVLLCINNNNNNNNLYLHLFLL